ncbi:hypothetical protein [Nocardia yamanashiensis]|uniref:hypothetical protein n=1 Tax=Nocardia yamanashiensis TaxID=209247 RepID=UPI00082F74F1|nr:hypothetical protein [Nocardia yamanashiensis]
MRITPARISLRRTGIGATGIAALAAAAVLAAPAALASVDTVTVEGSGYTVGKEYTISVTVSGAPAGLLVYYSDNGDFIGKPKVPWPPGKSSTAWTPSTAGKHTITVEQGGFTRSVVVDVQEQPIGSGSSSSGSGFGPGGPLGSGSSGTTPDNK